MKDNVKEIYLAGGCFWGTEHYIKMIKGVMFTEVGYANSIDVGRQYRTGIYYTDQDDLATINKVLLEQQKKYHNEIVVEVMQLENFYPAENYHQDYLNKNPNGYCHLPIELFEIAKQFNR